MIKNEKNNEYVYLIEKAQSFILKKIPKFSAKIAVVLGSGLQAFGDALENSITIPYSEIPGFPIVTVKGHAGKLIYGKTQNKNVVVMQGRVHLYEGWSPKEVTFYVRVLQFLGIKDLLLTSAAGAINEAYNPGDFVIHQDLINLTGKNPLIGKFDSRLGKAQFLDMSKPYDEKITSILESAVISEQKTGVHKGVYVCLLGPMYETPAEVRHLRSNGADLAGMSTVLEVIAAKDGGMSVAGMSLVTNKASGMQEKVNHEEVIVMGMQTSKKAIQILNYFFAEYFS